MTNNIQAQRPGGRPDQRITLVPHFFGAHNIRPFHEGRMEMKHAGLVVPSSLVIQSIDPETLPPSETFLFPCYSGTVVGYPALGTRSPDVIEKTDPNSGIVWRFPVPPEHRGKLDILLLAEFGDYDLTLRGNAITVEAQKVVTFGQFPQSSGLYMVDQEHGMPFGSPRVLTPEIAGLLHRLHRSRYVYVGPVTHTNDLQSVFIDMRPSFRLAFLRQEPES